MVPAIGRRGRNLSWRLVQVQYTQSSLLFDQALKRCVTCGVSKPLDAFSRKADAKDGRNSWCKACQSVYHAAWKIANSDKVKVNSHSHYERHKDEKAVYGAAWRAANKERHKAIILAWEEKNPDRVAAKSARYRERHPERFKQWQDERRDSGRRRIANLTRRALVAAAIVRGAEVTKDKLKARFNYFGWRCYYCGIPLTPKTVIAEHRIPLSRGGPHCCANIVPSCGPCNVRKSDHTEREFKSGRKGRRNYHGKKLDIS